MHWMYRPIFPVALAGWIVSPPLYFSNEAQFRDNQIWLGSRYCAPSRYSGIERIEVAEPRIAGYAATAHLRSEGTGVILLLVSAAGCEFALYHSHIQVDVLGVGCPCCVVYQFNITLLFGLAATFRFRSVQARRREIGTPEFTKQGL
jgi:hypothetical protein